ncbi:DUF397 domain-containing protein [Streptomyces sp. NPDC093249]|uniref:DUF397 domain-containing protein n=1 Tax=unclassified Streptomyces TaxID=2593676 RepID=UPI0037F5B32D
MRASEVAPTTAWSKSSYSDSNGGACIKVANLVQTVGVTDSKFADGPAFVSSPSAWSTFVSSVAAGAFVA